MRPMAIKRLSLVFGVLLAFFPLPLSAEITFSDLDLAGPAIQGADTQLLFRAGAAPLQDALFLSRLPSAGLPSAGLPSAGLPSAGLPSAGARVDAFVLRQLTAFPEKIDLLENGRTLQVRNSFGALRIPVQGGLPASIPGLPSFAGGNPGAMGGRAEEMAASSDGRWLLYLEPQSPAMGSLFMLDVQTGAKSLVASGLDRPEKAFPASWSPDSRLFIYSRGAKLYYYTAGSPSAPADERTRLIGEGTVNSVSWGRGGDFFYIRGSNVYLVRGAELFARAIYADILDIGTVAGRLPFEFDPSFDSFWIAPDAGSLLVSKGSRSLFFFPLFGTEDDSSRAVLPFFLLPRSCAGIKVLWPASGPVTILAAVPEGAGAHINVWRLSPAGSAGQSFEPLMMPASFHQASISPNGNLAVLWGPGGVLLYDYVNWKRLEALSPLPGYACFWIGNNELIIGDDQKIERIRLLPPEAETAPSYRAAGHDLICLSRATQFGFEEGSLRVLARNGDSWFVTDGRNPWAATGGPRIRSPSQVSAQYRVYLEGQRQGLYSNLPMVRNLSSTGTFPLFPPAASGSPAAVSSPGEAALCFDLYDDDTGLPDVLDALNRRGIRATFFINGEFIRRHPRIVAELASSGHEIASMFFSLMDLSDARYRTGADFIAQGLARNEDEYYRATGKELALLWHPPWYVVSQDIIASAAKAGYVTAGRDIDPMDWISRDDEKGIGLHQLSPPEMVDRIVNALAPGSVIPVRLGLLPGGRGDYLFNRINVLIDAMLREGYTLTTVSALMERREGRM